jgi:hypothetical protein
MGQKSCGHDVTEHFESCGQHVTCDKTVHLEAGVDKKYLDRSYSCKNVTGTNWHSRGFVGWTDSVGRIAVWSVCLWTDRQGTDNSANGLTAHHFPPAQCAIGPLLPIVPLANVSAPISSPPFLLSHCYIGSVPTVPIFHNLSKTTGTLSYYSAWFTCFVCM